MVLVPLSNVPKITADLTFLAGRGTSYREHPGVAQLAGRVLTEGTASRTSYKPNHTGDEILKEVDAVVRDVQEHGVTAKELRDAKVRFRSNFYDQLESTFGKANLLASFALFNDDPMRINRVVNGYEALTVEQLQSAAKKYLVPTNRTAIDRVPEKK